jgi:Skp family chaperone for outer membrane proteins
MQNPARIAVVSGEIILQQTPGFAQADSTWGAEVRSMQEELQRLRQEYDSAAAEFERQSLALTPTVRQERQAQLQQLGQRFQQRAGEMQTRAEQRRAELMAPLQDRVQAVIDGIRAERNYQLIFDMSAPGTGIVSVDRTIDLTAEVVRRLRGG